MVANNHADDDGSTESEIDLEDFKHLHPDNPNNPFDVRAGAKTSLDNPLTTVEFAHDEPKGQDSWVVNCPYCGGEKHYHYAYEYPRIAFGGISSARCKETGEPYYMILKMDCDVGADIIRCARQKLTNYPGEELEEPLIPRGVDPRIIDTICTDWSPGMAPRYE